MRWRPGAAPGAARRSRVRRGLVGAVAGGFLGQRFGLLSGFRVLAVLYGVLTAWHARGVLTETPSPLSLADGEPE